MIVGVVFQITFLCGYMELFVMTEPVPMSRSMAMKRGYEYMSVLFVVFKFVELVTYWPCKGQADDMSIYRCVHVRVHVVISTKNSERLFATMNV